MATFVLHLVTGQLAMTSRLSRSTTSTWFLALLLIYIFGLNFSSAIASSVSPSILMSANFLPAVVSTTLSIEYVWWTSPRSEEHTSELQSRFDLVCRLLLEKKKKNM